MSAESLDDAKDAKERARQAAINPQDEAVNQMAEETKKAERYRNTVLVFLGGLLLGVVVAATAKAVLK